jgi:cytosine/adenosine deaminase-related metal-dependent hydrolase
VALGTDSRASSHGDLSMVAAMAAARRMWPELPPAAVLAMATATAGRAIGRRDLGRIAVGGRADLCAFALRSRMSRRDALDAATSGALPLAGTWLCGRRIHTGGQQT